MNNKSQTIGTYEGCPVVAYGFGDKIYLACGSCFLALDPDAFKALLKLAENFGWMADGGSGDEPRLTVAQLQRLRSKVKAVFQKD